MSSDKEIVISSPARGKDGREYHFGRVYRWALDVHEGRLFEGTGLYGLSALRELGDDWPTQARPNVTDTGKPVPGMCLGLVFAMGTGLAVSQMARERAALPCRASCRAWRATLQLRCAPCSIRPCDVTLDRCPRTCTLRRPRSPLWRSVPHSSPAGCAASRRL